MAFRTKIVRHYLLCIIAMVLLVSLYASYIFTEKTFSTNTFPQRTRHAKNNINTIPSRAFDAKSPYYGMLRWNTYGLPRAAVENGKPEAGSAHWGIMCYFANLFRSLAFTSGEKRKDAWKKLFPSLVSAMAKYKKENKLKDPERFTHTATLDISKTEYNVGDEFVATLQSLDGRKKPKTFGGDYYRARLIHENVFNPDGVPCRVRDNEDGTYAVKAPLDLEGEFFLDVKLVMTFEGISKSLEVTNLSTFFRHKFMAQYGAGENVTQCDLELQTHKSKRHHCDYSNPRNNEPWICARPPSKICPRMDAIRYTGPGQEMIMNFNDICSTHKCQLSFFSGKMIRVSSYSNATIKSGFSLSQCSDVFRLSPAFLAFRYSYETSPITSSPGSFGHQHRWRTLKCPNAVQSLNKMEMCLKHKIVYFLGDNTIRYMFYFIVNNLWMYVEGPDNKVAWQQPKYARANQLKRKANITLYYRAHGPPIFSSGTPNTLPYISDSITDIPGGNGVYVTFAVGVHLLHYHPYVYARRLRGIRQAILKHHQHFPETRFLVKGFSVVEVYFEWYILRFEKILRDTFKGLANVAYLDFWDMTTLWPQHAFNPLPTDLKQQTFYLVSHFCNNP